MASSLDIPPWMKKEDYLELRTPPPDTFGVPLSLMPSQYKDMRSHVGDLTADQKIAWRILYIYMSDVVLGKPKKRLKSIDEIRLWIENRGDFIYTFSWWCECLGIDDDYFREGLQKFLTTAREHALAGSVSEELRAILCEVGGFKLRYVRTDNQSGNGERARGLLNAGSVADDGAGAAKPTGTENARGRGHARSDGAVDAGEVGAGMRRPLPEPV